MQGDRILEIFLQLTNDFLASAKISVLCSLKGVQRPAAFAIVCFCYVNFIQSVVLESMQNKSLTTGKACWPL